MSDDNLNLERPLHDYIDYFETLSRRSINLIDKIADPQIQFKDPFNDVQGIDAFKAVFEHMYETTQNPKFKVTDYAWGQKGKEHGNTAYIRWNFTFALKSGKQQSFDGMSEVMFSDAGKVMRHIDHWDAGAHVYEKIPLLGAAIRFVKSKLAIES